VRKPGPATRPRRRFLRRALEGAVVVGAYLVLAGYQERNLLPEDEARRAPPFELVDLTGQRVRLESFAGKKVLIHFWATWCRACKLDLAALGAVHRGLADDERLLSIVADADDPERVRRFVQEHGIEYPVLLATDEVIAAYRVAAFPTNYFVAPDGTIRDRSVGISTRWGLGARLGCAR
jgi:peroxiredoxin